MGCSGIAAEVVERRFAWPRKSSEGVAAPELAVEGMGCMKVVELQST
jgi:hypothetical protein